MNDDNILLYQAILNHLHDGNLSARINLSDIWGNIQTVDAVPTDAPNSVYGQFQIYSGTLYIYDFTNSVWIHAQTSGSYQVQGPYNIALFDYYTDANNVMSAETDLYTDMVTAGKLAANGDKLFVRYQGIFTGAVAATQELRMYFGGTKIYDSGALSIGVATNNWTMQALLIRESSSVVRCSVSVNSDFATLFPYSTYTRVTGLTLANAQIIKITGQAAGAGGNSNQITSTLGSITYQPHV